jgi:hypothetical protein
MMGVAEDGGCDDRVPCRICGRKFAPDRIDKHESTHVGGKRRVFNAKKQRLDGTEAAGYQRSANQKAPPKKEMINGKPKYKVEHENLVAALRAARKITAYQDAVAAGKAVGPPPPMPKLPEMPDDRIQCPGCGKKFGQVQYERHSKVCTGYTQGSVKRTTVARLPGNSRGRR